jgi:hypothetical protein
MFPMSSQSVPQHVLHSTSLLSHTSVGNPWLRHSSHPKKRREDPKNNEKKKKKKKHLPSLPRPTKFVAMVLLPRGHETVVVRHEVMYMVKPDGQSFVPCGHETTVMGHGTTVKGHDHMVQGHEVMHVCGSFMGVHEERGTRIGTEDHVAIHGWAKHVL